MTQDLTFFAGALLSLGCAVFGYFFLRAGRREQYSQAALRKGLAGLCFVVLGFLNMFFCGDKSFGQFTALGLALGLAGDLLLALRYVYKDKHDAFFKEGAQAFALGHALYIIALLRHDGGAFLPALPIFALGLLVSLLYFRVKKVDAGRLRLPSVLYIALVVLMASVACGAAIRGFSVGLLLFAVGGICFSVSDNLLCGYCFGTAHSPAVDRALHICYYAAQLFIAWSPRFL